MDKSLGAVGQVEKMEGVIKMKNRQPSARNGTSGVRKRVVSHASSVKNGPGVREKAALKRANFSVNKLRCATPCYTDKISKVNWRLVIIRKAGQRPRTTQGLGKLGK